MSRWTFADWFSGIGLRSGKRSGWAKEARRAGAQAAARRRFFSAHESPQSSWAIVRDFGQRAWQLLFEKRGRARRHYRPTVQALEARQLLATLMWTGDGADDLFNNPANWTVTSGTSATGFPGAGDDAIINADEDSAKVQVNTSATVNSISSSAGDAGEPFEITSGALTLTIASTFQNSFLLGGVNATITGGGVITVNGPMTWNGGTITDTNAANALAFNVNGPLLTIDGPGIAHNLTGRTLQLNCNTSWVAGNLTLDSAAVINNGAGRTFDITANTTATGGQFNNSGLVVRSTSIGTATISGSFTNAAAGIVEVRTGILSFTGTVTNISGSTLIGGTYIVNATLRFPGATSITGNSANIVLDGTAAAIENQIPANALANFATQRREWQFQD